MHARNTNKSQPTRTRVVRADDLSTALAKVRRAFGPDALVLGTRTVLVNDPESLAPRKQVEVQVAEPASAREAAAAAGAAPIGVHAYARQTDVDDEEPSDAADGDDVTPEVEGIRGRIERLREIADRVEGLSSRVIGGEDTAADYPLAAALRAAGTTERTLLHVAGSFRLAVRGGTPSVTAARRHLSRFVRGTRAISIKQMRGEHWLLGRAGSGKTTLTLFLAAHLTAEDVPCAIVSVAPPHEGDVARLRAAERALEIPVHVVRDEQELEAARESLSDRAVVLVDTPCFVGQELPITPPDHAQRHLVVPLGEDRELLRSHLAHARTWQPDCVALTQMDLYPCPGRLVDLAVEAGRPFSLIQGRHEGRLLVRVARGETLLGAILGEPDDPAA